MSAALFVFDSPAYLEEPRMSRLCSVAFTSKQKKLLQPNPVQSARPSTQYAAFTLLELLIVLGILSLLLGLLLPALWRAKIAAKETATKVMIKELERILNQYKTGNAHGGSFPIQPDGNPNILSGQPGYYSMTCAPMGSKSSGAENNRALAALLQKE